MFEKEGKSSVILIFYFFYQIVSRLQFSFNKHECQLKKATLSSSPSLVKGEIHNF